MFYTDVLADPLATRCQRWGCWQQATWRDPIPSIVWCDEHRHDNCLPLKNPYRE